MGGGVRREVREPREADAHGGGRTGSGYLADAMESNGHQPPFAIVAPSDLDGVNGASHGAANGATDGAEPHGWVPRIERQERPERTDRPPLRPGVRGDVGPLIEALHDIFERDRATASQGNAARCGICYLHFARSELVYREAEGFYACPTCAELLGATELNMVRRQQK